MEVVKRKATIQDLQQAMVNMPQVELKTDHFFADGMYARRVFRRQGTLIVGKVHKKEHFFIVASGKLAVTTDEGKNVYDAGSVVVSKPGTKRATLALEDTVAITVHRTDKKNLNKIEKQLVKPEPLALFGPGNVLKHKLIGVDE